MVFKTLMDGRVVCAQNLHAAPSEKQILSPAFHDDYFVPPLGFLPAATPIRKMPVRNLCHISVWYRIRFMRSFAMCRLLLGAFYRIEKQPAYLGLLNLRFMRTSRWQKASDSFN